MSIWQRFDLERIDSVEVKRDHTGWRLNIEGTPDDGGGKRGIYSSLFFKDREALREALTKFSSLAAQFNERELEIQGKGFSA